MPENAAPRYKSYKQRIIHRSRTYFILPIIALILLTMDLAMELVRQNVEFHAPRLLPVQSAATLVGVAATLVLARGQYARTVRPVLGGRFTRGDAGRGVIEAKPGEPPAGHFYLFNGGAGAAVVIQVRYQLVLSARASGSTIPPTGEMLHLRDAKRLLEKCGLVEEKDFYMLTLGRMPMPPMNEALKGVHLVSLNARAIYLIDDLVIRIRVVDQVGDQHERTFSGFISPHHRRDVANYFERAADPRRRRTRRALGFRR
jgi:hypothetical protein